MSMTNLADTSRHKREACGPTPHARGPRAQRPTPARFREDRRLDDSVARDAPVEAERTGDPGGIKRWGSAGREGKGHRLRYRDRKQVQPARAQVPVEELHLDRPKGREGKGAPTV